MSRFDIQWVRERLARHAAEEIDDEVAQRRAAVSIILQQQSAEECCSILFIHRSHHEDDPWSGHMAFPGGRIDPGDASPLHAARRETLEEVGLDLASGAELLGQLDDQQASARGAILPLAITPFVFHLLREAPLRPNREVAEALWIPVPRLLDPDCAGTVPWVYEGQRLDLPCFDYSGRIIWGLTYMMLTRFFRLLGWLAD